MMLGERTHHLSPTIQVPPWPVYDDISSPASPYTFTASIGSPPSAASSPGGGGGGDILSPYLLNDSAFSTALQRFLPSNDLYLSSEEAAGGDDSVDATAPVDAYSCDEFRMYEFKVRRCARGRSHDWTECPYAHPGEKARRRDPRKYHYSGAACPDFRKGSCKRGDSCEFAHGVFECWLHPARYRTQPCKDGVGCRRRVCFFAHTSEQLRVLPHSASGGAAPAALQSPRSSASPMDSYDGSPLRKQQQQHLATLEAYFPSSLTLSMSSPSSAGPVVNSNLVISPPLSPPSGDSPPMSPSSGLSPSSIRRASVPSASVNEIVASLRQLQLCKAKSAPSSWGLQQQQQQLQLQIGSGSPRGAAALAAYPASGFNSLPSTPTRLAVMNSAGGAGLFEGWGEDQPMERVESGRDLRAKLAEKLSKENPLESCGSMTAHVSASAAPDVDWVSELLM